MYARIPVTPYRTGYSAETPCRKAFLRSAQGKRARP